MCVVMLLLCVCFYGHVTDVYVQYVVMLLLCVCVGVSVCVLVLCVCVCVCVWGWCLCVCGCGGVRRVDVGGWGCGDCVLVCLWYRVVVLHGAIVRSDLCCC